MKTQLHELKYKQLETYQYTQVRITGDLVHTHSSKNTRELNYALMKEQRGTHLQNQTQGRITGDLTSSTQTHYTLTKGTRDKIMGDLTSSTQTHYKLTKGTQDKI